MTSTIPERLGSELTAQDVADALIFTGIK
jgi:hypothetical protein